MIGLFLSSEEQPDKQLVQNEELGFRLLPGHHLISFEMMKRGAMVELELELPRRKPTKRPECAWRTQFRWWANGLGVGRFVEGEKGLLINW